MRLGFEEAWVGRRRRIAVCPICGGARARYSRRHYEGLWFVLFGVRPVKCSDCGLYYPMAGHGDVSHPPYDPEEVHIPFQPSELDEAMARAAESAADPGSSEPPILSRRKGSCQNCGANALRPSRPGPDRRLRLQLDPRDPYRCLACNASFKRLNMKRLVVLGFVYLAVVAALAYFVASLAGGPARSNRPPRIMKDQLPPQVPPVFR